MSFTDASAAPAPRRTFISGSTGTPLVWVVFALVVANSGLYSILISGGLVQADSWYFLDTFVRQYLDGSISWRSFLINRGGADHVQVLPKVVLLFHLHYFDLDFKVEALIGWIFGVIGAATLIAIHFRAVPADRRSASFFFATAATVALYLSLNATNLYTWSLVTLGFMGVWFFLLTCVAAWAVFASGRGFVPLLAAGTLVCITSDKFAILALLSLAGALFIQVNDRASARRALLALSAIAIPALIMWWVVRIPGIRPPAEQPPVQWAALAAMFLSSLHPWREVVLMPLSSALVHGWQLDTLPPWRVHVESALGLAMAGVHLAFWWTIALHRRRAPLAAIVACALMLLAYGSTAGIVLHRVVEFGPEYMRQPRYVALYMLGAVACLLWFTSLAHLGIGSRDPWQQRNRRPWKPLGRSALLIASVAILVIQIPMSVRSWDFVKYVSNYQQVAATQMGQLLADPKRVPPGCVDILVVCQLPPLERAELMTLLEKHRLNVFSPRFQMLWRLYPQPRTRAAPQEATAAGDTR